MLPDPCLFKFPTFSSQWHQGIQKEKRGRRERGGGRGKETENDRQRRRGMGSAGWFMPEQLNRGPCGKEVKSTAFALGGINNPRARGSL